MAYPEIKHVSYECYNLKKYAPNTGVPLTALLFSCLVVPIVTLGVWPVLNHPSSIRNRVTNGLHHLKVQGERLQSLSGL